MPLVIRAAQPVLVDTGPPIFREDYLASVFSLIDPDEVRWIFLSHDDRDHSGNLMTLLEAPVARARRPCQGCGAREAHSRAPTVCDRELPRPGRT